MRRVKLQRCVSRETSVRADCVAPDYRGGLSPRGLAPGRTSLGHSLHSSQRLDDVVAQLLLAPLDDLIGPLWVLFHHPPQAASAGAMPEGLMNEGSAGGQRMTSSSAVLRELPIQSRARKRAMLDVGILLCLVPAGGRAGQWSLPADACWTASLRRSRTVVRRRHRCQNKVTSMWCSGSKSTRSPGGACRSGSMPQPRPSQIAWA